MVNYYYIVLIMAYFFCVFYAIRPAVIMFAYNFVLIFFRIFPFKRSKNVRISSVGVYTLWCCLSVIMFLLNGMPLSIFITSLVYMGTPIVCYYTTNNPRVDCEIFFTNFLLAVAVNDLFGTICFYLKPDFYVSFITRTSETASAQLLHHAGVGRLVTLFGSIETGSLSAMGIIVALGLIIRYKSKNKIAIISLIMCAVSLILSQQRGPMFTIVFVMLFLIFYSVKERLVKPRVIIIMVVISIIVMYYLSINNPTVFMWIIDRMLNPTNAITERTNYQFDVIYNHYNIFQWAFGNGIGSCEMFARGYTRNGLILDAMYLNILGEVGIIGLLIYVFIIIESTRLFFKNVKNRFIPFFIVFQVCFVGLGTTLIYYPQIIPVFWFSLGVLFNKRDVFENKSINLSNT